MPGGLAGTAIARATLHPRAGAVTRWSTQRPALYSVRAGLGSSREERSSFGHAREGAGSQGTPVAPGSGFDGSEARTGILHVETGCIQMPVCFRFPSENRKRNQRDQQFVQAITNANPTPRSDNMM